MPFELNMTRGGQDIGMPPRRPDPGRLKRVVTARLEGRLQSESLPGRRDVRGIASLPPEMKLPPPSARAHGDLEDSGISRRHVETINSGTVNEA